MSDTVTPTNNVIVNKPDLYHGDRTKLDDWLMQWDLFFLFQGEKIPENKRVVLASSYMRGNAFKWIKPFIQQYNDGTAPEEVDAWVSDFDEFKKKVKPVFGVSNEPTIARRDIQRMRQTKSAADYAAEFQQLAANTDWDDTALMTMFRQGLKPRVKEELMRTGASTDTLDELINTAIDIDVKLYELQLELRDDPRARPAVMDRRSPPRNPWRNNLSNRGNRGGSRYQPNSGRRIHSNTQSGYYGPEAMDLSNLNKGGPDRWNKKSKGSTPDKSKMTCYGCGKQGHFARDCRMKNKVVRQLNVLATNDNGTSDEWEVLTDDMGCLEMDTESEEDLEEGLKVYDRSPTPYPEPENADYKAHDLSQKHREIFGDPSRPRRRQVIKNVAGKYHAICARKEGNHIVLGERHDGDFIQQGDKYFTPDNKELMVIEKTPATMRVEHELLDTLDQQRCDELLDDEAEVPEHNGDIKDLMNHWETERRTLVTDHLGLLSDDDHESYVESEEADSEEEDFYDTEEQRPFKEARMIIANDGQGLTGLNRQIANASFTSAEWCRVTYYRDQETNKATRAELDLYNRHAPSRSEPDWNRRMSPATPDRQCLFWRDIRNPKHKFISWEQCYQGSCKIHYTKKVEHKWFPTINKGCNEDWWYECYRTQCEDHLWDKRTMVHFPGVTDPKGILQTQLVLNGECSNKNWEICLNAACQRHLKEKEVYGFIEQQKPFLGQRRRSTWNDPLTTLGSTNSSNSPSN
jgi:hypothetical protein